MVFIIQNTYIKEILLSVIIPVYNKQDYIEELLNVFLNWKNSNTEFIFINDGSTDNSQIIIEDYLKKDSRFKLINTKNGGVSVARNTGLSNANGKWIWFIDSDDIPQMSFADEFFTQVNLSEFDVFMGNFYKISDKKIDEVVNNKYGLINQDQLIDSFMQIQFASGYYGYLWNKIISKKIIDINNIKFKEKLTLAEDLDFMISVYENSKKVFATAFIAMKYRVETVNSSKEKEIDYREQLRINIKIMDWIVEKNSKTEYNDFFRKRITFYSAMIVFYDNEKGISPKKTAQEILNNDELKKLLIYVGKKDVMQKIAYYLLNNKLNRLNIYIKSRTFLKKIRNIRR